MSDLVTYYLVHEKNTKYIWKVCFKAEILKHYSFPCYVTHDSVKDFIHNDSGPAIILYELKVPAFHTYQTQLFDTLENLNLSDCLGNVSSEHYYINGNWVGKAFKAYTKEDLIPHLNNLLLK